MLASTVLSSRKRLTGLKADKDKTTVFEAIPTNEEAEIALIECKDGSSVLVKDSRSYPVADLGFTLTV